MISLGLRKANERQGPRRTRKQRGRHVQRTRHAPWRFLIGVAVVAFLLAASGQDRQKVEVATDQPLDGFADDIRAFLDVEPQLADVKPTPSPSPLDRSFEGTGSFDRASGVAGAAADAAQLQYRVEVENGLGESAERFASDVDGVLGDRRGWVTAGWSFLRTKDASTRIVLASPSTTDQLCAPLRTKGEVSCRNGDDIVINAKRWFTGAPTYGSNLSGYRQYLINHEVGHRLGNGHETCPAPESPAPVMVQQTKSLEGCTTNPWLQD